MLILLHVSSALGSVIIGGLAWLTPSVAKLRAVYGLIALTLASGSYLVWTMHAPMVQSCLSGVIYLAFVLFETFAARQRLATARSRTDKT